MHDSFAIVREPPVALTEPAGRPRAWRSARLVPGAATSAGALFTAALILVAPIASIFIGVIDVGPAAVARALSNTASLAALGLSFSLALIAVIVHATLGTATALVLARQRFRGRALFDALLELPLSVSPVMTGLAFILLCGRGGWLTPVLDVAGVKVPFAYPGLVIATLFVTLPFVAREVIHILEELGDSEEQAASTLGASALRTFAFVTLPNIAPALASGVTLTAARALGEFGAVLVLGGAIAGRTETATTAIYMAFEERNPAVVNGMALVLVAASMLLVGLLARTRRASAHDGRTQ